MPRPVAAAPRVERTNVVQTARMREIGRRIAAGGTDFHTVFHNFCEQRVTSRW
jgi:hypothetical protein